MLWWCARAVYRQHSKVSCTIRHARARARAGKGVAGQGGAQRTKVHIELQTEADVCVIEFVVRKPDRGKLSYLENVFHVLLIELGLVRSEGLAVYDAHFTLCVGVNRVEHAPPELLWHPIHVQPHTHVPTVSTSARARIGL